MFGELLTRPGAIEEPRRSGKVEHRPIDALAITVCAVLAHAEPLEVIALYGKHKEKWVRQFSEPPNGIPSHETFRRVFMLMNSERFEACFWAWTQAGFCPREGLAAPDCRGWQDNATFPLTGAKATLPCMWSARLRHSPE